MERDITHHLNYYFKGRIDALLQNDDVITEIANLVDSSLAQHSTGREKALAIIEFLKVVS